MTAPADIASDLRVEAEAFAFIVRHEAAGHGLTVDARPIGARVAVLYGFFGEVYSRLADPQTECPVAIVDEVMDFQTARIERAARGRA